MRNVWKIGLRSGSANLLFLYHEFSFGFSIQRCLESDHMEIQWWWNLSILWPGISSGSQFDGNKQGYNETKNKHIEGFVSIETWSVEHFE